MNARQLVALGLADAFLDAGGKVADLRTRGAEALGRNWPWLEGLSERIVAGLQARWSSLERSELAAFISADKGFDAAWRDRAQRPRLRRYSLNPARMAVPIDALSTLSVPPIANTAALADWMDISLAELDWFSGTRGGERRTTSGPLRHYVYRWIPKRSGGHRLLEIPKSRLREHQRHILHAILDRLPPHEAAHGFRRGRSCRSHVEPHVARPVVVRMDLKNFFTAVSSGRVQAIFRSLGYPPGVARCLGALCTNRVPEEIFAAQHGATDLPALTWTERKALQAPHLPQGAPSSPALANLAAFRLDTRLSGLAAAVGARYTRYADDLAFSGDRTFGTADDRFHVLVCRIAREEGFELNTRKTRVMRSSLRQRLTGIVINIHPNVTRSEYDELKAILHNCARFGPQSQNRHGHGDFAAHLSGRISHVLNLNPNRGEKLRRLFADIDWPSVPADRPCAP